MKRMIRSSIIFIALSFVLLLTCCQPGNMQNAKETPVRGDYFGQMLPGDTARLFAPEIISTGMNERDFAITPDGDEIFFSRDAGNYRYSAIFRSQRVDGSWSVPVVFEYCTNPDYKYIEPALSPDGKKLFFVSTMPAAPGSEGNEDIWVCTRTDGGWSEPRNLGSPVNTTSKEFFPSVTADGTIYYTHLDTVTGEEFIYRSGPVNGVYQQPEKLGANVNIGRARYNAFVAVDESYIIIPAYGMPDSYGATDYYISFRDSLDNWSKPLNMGPQINTAYSREWSASVSPDGMYIFFMSDKPGGAITGQLSAASLQNFHNTPQNGNTDIYWISSSVIDGLREKAVEQ
jgi:Tol biopolymer transport system component